MKFFFQHATVIATIKQLMSQQCQPCDKPCNQLASYATNYGSCGQQAS